MADLIDLDEGTTVRAPDGILPLPAPDAELGISLDTPFRSWRDEVFNPAEVDIPDLLARIDTMLRTDGHFRALSRLLSLPFRQAKWSIVADGDGDDEAAFITDMLTRPPYQGGMTTTFDYVRALAAKAFWQGFAVWEEVYTYADLPDFGRMLTLRKLAPREARTLRFRADDHGGFLGVTQRATSRAGGLDTIEIPGEKVLFFTVDREEHPFYGRSMFEPCLYHFDKKHKLYYVAHIAAQITAVPGRVASQDGATGASQLSSAEKTALRTALANFGFNTALVLPPGVTLDEFGAGSTGTGIDAILNLINHHNIQGSQSVLAQFIDLGQQGGGGGGSYALSKDGSDTFLMACQALLDSFAEVLTNHLFPKFIDWNFASGKYPRIVFEPLADETKAALMEVFSTIATAGSTQTTPDFIFELEKKVADMLGLEVDYDQIEADRQAEADRTDAVADVLAAITGDGIGLDPFAAEEEPAAEPAPVGLSEAEAVFLADDLGAVIELATANYGGLRRRSTPTEPDENRRPVGTTTDPKEAARRRRLAEKGKRDKLGQFSRVNEIGQGRDGLGSGPLAAATADVQARLRSLGYDLGSETGFGKLTAKAVAEFQRENGNPVTGRVDLMTYSALLEQAPKGTATLGADVAAWEDAAAKAEAAAKKAAKKKAAAKKKRAAPRGPARNVAEAAARMRAAKAAGGRRSVSDDED